MAKKSLQIFFVAIHSRRAEVSDTKSFLLQESIHRYRSLFFGAVRIISLETANHLPFLSISLCCSSSTIFMKMRRFIQQLPFAFLCTAVCEAGCSHIPVYNLIDYNADGSAVSLTFKLSASSCNVSPKIQLKRLSHSIQKVEYVIMLDSSLLFRRRIPAVKMFSIFKN